MPSTPHVVATAAVFLRPLRYMFDVEADVEIVPDEGSTTRLHFDTVRVHLRAATQPPLMERDELLNGFLRAEAPIYSSAVSTDFKESKEIGDNYDSEGERELNSLRGTYIWILVRLQPLGKGTSLIPEAKGTKEAIRVQYQVSPASESFCLPVDHTNVVKVLVTDELIDQVNKKLLQFNFLSVPLNDPDPLAKEAEVKTLPIAPPINYNEAALAASEAAAAEEIRRRQQIEAELVEAKSAAQAKDRERLDAQLQAKQDAQRAQELELARNEQVHARSLLEQELASREYQNQELQRVRKQLEEQLEATNQSAQRFQINISSTDQALEMLKQRAVSDAKEREELQRRLRVLEEEKLALQNKSRACRIQ
ncbi:hypothetical protein DVH05_001514 [Phytophthora capsici]|nr:hypothetical protein DVH05_001514 [Phytophthora capsici]